VRAYRRSLEQLAASEEGAEAAALKRAIEQKLKLLSTGAASR
jgi:hypothetical protein